MNEKARAAVIFGGSAVATAALGTLFTPARQSIREWYDGLRKSKLNPPNAVFGPVWTGLYTLIAISGAKTFRKRKSQERTDALRLWAAQMVLNAAWSPLFFGAKKPVWSLVDMSILLPTIVAYARKAKAPWLMAPYIAWVSFAMYLNIEIVRLNRANAAEQRQPA
ncbi:MAG: tryptophan-rich sensory protein [Acidobacteria bacterium]|nr:tryptophan-rich sensory protein [Acidobacteriota bacterium]